MPLSRFLAALCCVLGSRLKPVATPLQNLFSPKLDPLEDRCLMASNLLAIGSPEGGPPLVKLLDRDYQRIFTFTWSRKIFYITKNLTPG